MMWRLLVLLGIMVENSQCIYHGEMAFIEDIPFMVKLFVRFDYTYYVCGGAYISDRWVLTTAKCVEGKSRDGVMTACMGSSHATTDWCFQIRQIREAIELKKANEEEIDIAIAKIDRPFVLGRTIGYARLPPDDDFFDYIYFTDIDCTIAGWGEISEDESKGVVADMRVTKLHIQLPSECNFSDNYWCSEVKNSPCMGDSGSPIVCRGVVVGLLTHGTKLTCKPQLTYYLVVHRYLDFIYGVMNGTYNASRMLHINWMFLTFLTSSLLFILIN